MKVHSFITRLQELNAYSVEFPSDAPGQDTELLSSIEIMDIIHRQQGFNYVDSTAKEMTEFFETRVESLEPRDEKKCLLWPATKRKKRNPPIK